MSTGTMKHSLPLFFLLTVLFLALISKSRGEGITCFKCTVAPAITSREKTSQICSHFDGSEEFQVECPKSTFCMKRTIHHSLPNGTIINTSVERGCTPQRDVFQAYDFDKRTWHNQERIVESAYQEGCTIGEDRGSPGGPPEYCFCSGDLCNSSMSQYQFHHIFYLSTFSLIIFLRNQL